jgi:hypothetical protein
VNNIRVPGVDDIYPRTSIAADTALELAYDGLTVLATSQTGRNAKARPNKMPQLNDAEGSGKVEQNSHMVIGIYRHDYYTERGEAKPSDAFPPGRTLLTILKNRTGGSGKGIPVQFIPGIGYEYDNWRTLPAGAALDILIAQHKGWRVVEEPNGWVRVFEPNGSSHFNESDAWGGKMPAYYLEDVWGYSVELDEAFKPCWTKSIFPIPGKCRGRT